jgi:hypothetical protein
MTIIIIPIVDQLNEDIAFFTPEKIPDADPPVEVKEGTPLKRTFLLMLLLYIFVNINSLFKRNKGMIIYQLMLFRNSDGTLVEIKRSHFKNDQLFYSKIMSVKLQKDTKQKTIQNAFIVKEPTKMGAYSKKAIDNLMHEFS